jgi:hypothetical protein
VKEGPTKIPFGNEGAKNRCASEDLSHLTGQPFYRNLLFTLPQCGPLIRPPLITAFQSRIPLITVSIATLCIGIIDDFQCKHVYPAVSATAAGLRQHLSASEKTSCVMYASDTNYDMVSTLSRMSLTSE